MNIPTLEARALRPIAVGGITAGVLDLVAVSLVLSVRGIAPLANLQFIASGLLGVRAFRGGIATATLGLALHFFIATGVAAVYYCASRWIPGLVRHPIPAGGLYGIGVYAMMTFVVLPLSAVPSRHFSLGLAAILVVIKMVCVRLPIAFATRGYAGAARQR